MKVIIRPLYFTLALFFTFRTAIAYLPSIAAMIQQAQETEINPASPTNIPASVQNMNFTLVKTSFFNRQRPTETQDIQQFNFTPGPIPASHLIKPRSECASPGTGSGSAGGSGTSGVHGKALMEKGCPIALLVGLVGAGVLL